MNRLPANSPRARRRLQNGVGLIEILVAVLVLSIGALGIALMQSHSLANNSSSMGRSMAVMMNYSILEALRADRINAEAGSYNGTVTGNSCPTTTTTLANRQVKDWCTQLGTVLGATSSTTGNINCTGPASDKRYYCTVTVTFDDSRIGNNVSAGTNAAASQAGGASAQTVVTKAML